MSSSLLNGPVRTTVVAKIQLSASTRGGASARKSPERWPVVLSAAYGVSLLVHVIALVILAFLFLRIPLDESLAYDSVLKRPVSPVKIDRVRVEAPAAVAKKSVPARAPATASLLLMSAAHTDKLSLDVPVPDGGGSGNGGSGDGGGEGGDGKAIFGSGREANSFVFVVDCSSSMMGGERFNRAIKELLRVIGNLKINQRFFVIFYSSETIPMFAKQTMSNPFSIIKRPRGRRRFARPRLRKRIPKRPKRTTRSSRKHKLVAATAKNKKRSRYWITKIRPAGGTNPGEALRMALSMRPEVVYFLTDGEIPPYMDIVIRDGNKSKVKVNTVALGFDGSAEILRRIANENDGRFMFVK